MRTAVMALAALLCGMGCSSAYQKTYDEELARLEAQEAQRQAAEQEAARAAACGEVKSYAAVVYFEVGSSMIHEDGYRELRWFADKFGMCREAQVDVKGYADSMGHEQLNQQLSTQRANAVTDFLVQQGVPRPQIAPAGFSSNFPERTNDTDHGRSRNRRAEVSVR